MRSKLHIGIAEYRKLSDEELVYRYCSKHEHKSMHVIYERYSHLIYGICMQYVHDGAKAHQLTEELFISLLADINGGHIGILKPWMLQYVNDYCRQQVAVALQSANDEQTHIEKETPVNADEVEDKLDAAVASLPADERACIEMFYLKNMSYSEIAASKKLSTIQIKNLLQAGKQHIKLNLGVKSKVNHEPAV